MDYDDETQLTKYVWDNYQHLMTEFERRVGLAIIARQKAESSSPSGAEVINQRWAGLKVAEIDAALEEGVESFRRKVRERLVVQYQTDISVKRCPNCKRVVRTPKAQQCFWCSHDWHQ